MDSTQCVELAELKARLSEQVEARIIEGSACGAFGTLSGAARRPADGLTPSTVYVGVLEM